MTKDLMPQRNEILRIRQEIKKLKEKEKELLTKLQEFCPHEITIKLPSQNSYPPCYICVFCALEKQGWSISGDERAIKNVLSNEEFYKFRELVELAEIMFPRSFLIDK